MTIIRLPYGNNSFDSNDLINHIRNKGRGYIIQGQANCIREDHPKPNSLDCWLRDNYTNNINTTQAVNEVLSELLKTGMFEEGHFDCPDSGRICKGLKVIKI